MSETMEAPAAAATTREVELRVKQFVAIRDKIKEIEDRHATELEEPKAIKDLLQGLLMKLLEAVGADSIKTSEGTCFNSTRYTASLADPKAFMDFVIQQSNWDLLDRKANATAVRDYVAENSVLPPGVNLSAIRTVNVRRPTK